MKKYIGILIVVLATIGAGFYFTSKQKEESKKPDVLQEAIKNETPKKELRNEEKIATEGELIKYIHRLTHPVIIANEKWHKDVIPTKENIQKAIDTINENEYTLDNQSKEAIKILNDFKNGQFSEADTLHNMMWEIQGGEVGKAKGVDRDAIKIITEKYY